MKKHYGILWKFLILTGFIFVAGCGWSDPDPIEPTPVDSTLTINQHIYNTFKEWYLWDDQLPELDPDTFQTADALVDALKYKTYDRWSYTASYSELQKLFSNSQYTGYGGSLMYDADGVLKMARVYTDSPFGRAKVQRGWKVKSVNGFEGSNYAAINESLSSSNSATFEMFDLEGKQHTLQLTKTEVKINTVLHSEIIEWGNKKIGYLVFDSFYQNSIEELKTEFTRFSQQKVTELIIDLRYNGGGLVNTAYYLTGLLGGNRVSGKTITHMVHNNQKKSENKSFTLSSIGPSANTAKVYFITTRQTASASEMTINALIPFMPVTLVGSATTGKPVGMYIIEVKKYDLAIVPISFINLNAQNKADYYNGLQADIMASDDLDHNWGNRDENMLRTALDHIQGLVSIDQQKEKSLQEPLTPKYKGIYSIVNAY
jgi:carboxyl-terminal processing protease